MPAPPSAPRAAPAPPSSVTDDTNVRILVGGTTAEPVSSEASTEPEDDAEWMRTLRLRPIFRSLTDAVRRYRTERGHRWRESPAPLATKRARTGRTDAQVLGPAPGDPQRAAEPVPGAAPSSGDRSTRGGDSRRAGVVLLAVATAITVTLGVLVLRPQAEHVPRSGMEDRALKGPGAAIPRPGADSAAAPTALPGASSTVGEVVDAPAAPTADAASAAASAPAAAPVTQPRAQAAHTPAAGAAQRPPPKAPPPPRPAARPAATNTSGAPAKKPGCASPSYVNAEGKTIWKPECL